MENKYLKTPRGEIVISDKTESELRAEGYGAWFWFEDWVILGKNNHALATKKERY